MKVLDRKIIQSGWMADLKIYLWEDSQEYQTGVTRPCILICPGGGYHFVSDRENQAVAMQYLAMGYHVAVLTYSVAPAMWPTALHQLAEAVALLREHSGEWFIDPDKIVVEGFSAGGHLAASLAVLWHRPEIAASIGRTPEQIRPNAMILCYAVLIYGEKTHRKSWQNLLGSDEERKKRFSLEKLVTPQCPPCFLWHTGTDMTVPVENSLYFACALRENGVPFDLHIFERGRHGLSLANDLTAKSDLQKNVCIERWMEQSHLWIKQLFESDI